MIATSQASPTGQHVLISHPSPGAPAQFVLNQPMIAPAPNQVFLSANGTLVAMPAAPTVQNVVYNQLPDGTLVQMQSPMTMQPQQGPFVINNNQQLSPNAGMQFQNPGTFIMTP